jgi:hypothetical protein
MDFQTKFNVGLEALKRVDKSIAFAETKAAFIVAVVGFAINLLLDQTELLIQFLISGSFWPSMLTVVSLFLMSVGTGMVFVCSLVLVYPRLTSKKPSIFYFNSIQKFPREEFLSLLANATEEKILSNLLNQLHTVSGIATRKFQYLKGSVIGAALVFIGWLVAISVIFFSG